MSRSGDARQLGNFDVPTISPVRFGMKRGCLTDDTFWLLLRHFTKDSRRKNFVAICTNVAKMLLHNRVNQVRDQKKSPQRNVTVDSFESHKYIVFPCNVGADLSPWNPALTKDQQNKADSDSTQGKHWTVVVLNVAEKSLFCFDPFGDTELGRIGLKGTERTWSFCICRRGNQHHGYTGPHTNQELPA